jgi:alpha-N-acetylglucosamine transferase
VIEVKDIPLPGWIHTAEKRWKHQFNKLHLFQWVQYDRVVFIDADHMLTGPIDDMFYDESDSVAPSKTDYSKIRPGEPQLPGQYVFLARPDYGYMGRESHPLPADAGEASDYLNAGFWLAAPSMQLFDYMIAIMQKKGVFKPRSMEQNLFNYVFRRCDNFINDGERRCPEGDRTGPMAWTEMDFKWASTYPTERDMDAGVRALHDKFWNRDEDDPLRMMWDGLRMEMEGTMGKSIAGRPEQ